MEEKKIEKYIRILLYSATLIPLLYISGFIYPYIITKTLFFRLIIQIALSFYIYLLVINYNKYKPRINFSLLLVLIFLLVNFISGIIGYDFNFSFWSSFERMEGIILYIYLAFYLFLLFSFFKEKKYWLYYLRLIVFSSILVSLYGLVQKFNILPVYMAGVGRVASTVGNAALLAGFLILAIGLGAYYYFNEENKKYKYITIFSVILNTIVLLFTSTRGAILGLALGLIVFLLINSIFSKGKLRKNSLIFLIVFILFISGFFVFRQKIAGLGIEFLNRMATITIDDSTVSNRLKVWQIAIKGFKERPLLGSGIENFYVVFNKYYTPEISEDWFDRTHNIYLDQLSNSGIIGLVIYLYIIFYLFYKLFRTRKEDYLKFSILTSMLIAYCVHNFFVFDSINTLYLFYFIIGFLCFNNNQPEVVIVNKNKSTSTLAVNSAIILLLVFNFYSFYKLIYEPYKINSNVFTGYYYTLADPKRSYESFKEALSYKFGSNETSYQLVKMFDVLEAEPTSSKNDLVNFYNLSREKLKYAIKNYPFDVRIKLYLGQLIINNFNSNDDLIEAENVLKDSIKLNPGRPEGYYLLFNVYLNEKENNKGVAVLEDLINKLPMLGEPKIILASYLEKNDPKKAESLFNEGIKQGCPNTIDNLRKIISYLLDKKNYKDTISYYIKLINLVPEKYDYRMDLAQIYYLEKDINNAKEQVEIVKNKSPELLDKYTQFINLLNSQK